MMIVTESVGEWPRVTIYRGHFQPFGAGRAVKERDPKILHKAGGRDL